MRQRLNNLASFTNGIVASTPNVSNYLATITCLFGVVDFSKTDIDLKIGSLCYGNR